MSIGEGKIDHKTAIGFLKDSRYEGLISGEWINWEHFDIHLPREIKILRGLEE